ncbi:MAG: VWA domain-containing protein [Acidobacteriota bacterium]|jgi:Ca-activated chloride channel family protein
MGIQLSFLKVMPMGLAALLALPLVFPQTARPSRGQRVLVIAAKTSGDAQLYRHCGRPSSYVPPPFHAPELFPSADVPVPGGIPDSEVRRRIEKEFLKLKKYPTVESLADADLVFFVQAAYSAWVEMRSGPQLLPPDLSGRGGVGPPPAPGGTYIIAGAPDEKPNVLSSAIAIVVPAEVYRDNFEDSTALLKAALWEGMVNGVNEKSASVETLVKQFDGGARLPANMQICSVSQPRHALAGQAIGIHEPSLKGATTAHVAAPEKTDASVFAKTIRVDVALVTVPVVVSGESGGHVSDLKESDFHVFEDGVEQTIDRLIPEKDPFNIGLLLDTSHSTRFNIAEIQRAAFSFVAMLRPVDRLMLISFNNRVFVDSEFTSNRDQLVQAISQIHLGDATRLYDALDLALAERFRTISGRKAIVLFTDGVDTFSGLSDEAGTLAQYQGSDVPVYIIQYDTQRGYPSKPSDMRAITTPQGYLNRDPTYARAARYLQDLGDASGGHVFHAETPESVGEAFSAIADELAHQYTLCYYPANRASDGSLRRIRVEIDHPGAKVRARSGYRAGSHPASDKK